MEREDRPEAILILETRADMAKPIFVVGNIRTGTTWLANILCLHSNIAGIQAERHWGIHESAFFSHVANKFGDLRNDNNFIQFLEMFASSDYFILSNLDKNIFYKKRPTTYHGFFRLFMDSFANKEGVDFWVEKTPVHSYYLDQISSYYKDAIFLAIKRDPVDVIRSIIKLYTMKRPITKYKKTQCLRHLVSYYECCSHIEQFKSKSNKMMLINYEELKKQTEKTVNEICKFLGINFESQMLKMKYKPNTVFKCDEERKEVLSLTEKKLIRLIGPILEKLPYQFYHLTYLMRKPFRNENKELPSWFYSIIKDEKLGKAG